MSIENIKFGSTNYGQSEHTNAIDKPSNAETKQTNSITALKNEQSVRLDITQEGLIEKQKLAKQEDKLAESKRQEAEKAAQEKLSLEDKEKVEQTVGIINQLIPLKNTNLIFEFDDITEPPIIKVVDKESEEVIREIPPQELKKIAEALSQMADNISENGVLFNSEV
jgi:flagellar protein FlaG